MKLKRTEPYEVKQKKEQESTHNQIILLAFSFCFTNFVFLEKLQFRTYRGQAVK